MKTYNVVAAVIVNSDRILCMQRNESKYDYISLKWEFPGGKVEDNETEEEALIREAKEELNLDIIIEDKLITVAHEYPDFKIIMHTFLCFCLSKDIILNDHKDFKWLKKEELRSLDWAAADVPIVDKLMNT